VWGDVRDAGRVLIAATWGYAPGWRKAVYRIRLEPRL